MALTYTDQNQKSVLHAEGRFQATVSEVVKTGDLLAFLNTGTANALELADQSTSKPAQAIALENGAAGDTIWCAESAELQAPVTAGVGGTQTQVNFAASGDFLGSPIYLGESGKPSSTVGTTYGQPVGYVLARERILISVKATVQGLLDNEMLVFGTGNDAVIYYDGTDLIIKPALVGSGDVVITGGSAEFDDDEGVRFGTGKDTEIRWSDGDADNHSLVIALGDSNQGLHITDLGAIATDWNIGATTHPNVYIHSNTTPATDYLRLGDHDGTTAYIDVVGGTTLALEIAGTTAVQLTATNFQPNADDGVALGVSGTAFADVFLASGAVINFNAGDITITHEANKLSFAGASTGYFFDDDIDLGSAGHLLNIGGTGTSLTAQQLNISKSNSGGTNEAHVKNTSNTGGSNADLRAEVGGTSAGDPTMTLVVSGGATFLVGVDNSASDIMVINRGGTIGTDDVIRVTDASPPVITYNTTHPTGTFDYVCPTCGHHSDTPFLCHGQPAEWRDDVMDFRAMVLREPGAVEYMEKIGVMERSYDNDGRPELFTTLGADWMFVGAMAYQNRQRMDQQHEEHEVRFCTMEDRVEAVEEALEIVREQVVALGATPEA